MVAQNLIKVKSSCDFRETIAIVKASLEERNISIFAVFDHQFNAKKVNLNLNPSTVIVFGSAKMGTLLMQENQDISIELPLKINIIQDKKGEIWVSHFKMTEMAEKYGLARHPIILKMEKLFTLITKKIQLNNNNGNRN